MKKLILLILLLSFHNLSAELVQHSKEIIKDNKTGLLWQDNDHVKNKLQTYKEALAYCSSLELDGVKNWQVPGFVELFSIIDTKSYNPSISKAFKNVQAKNYWTTKLFSHGVNSQAFVIDFKSGAFNRKKMNQKYYVRCYKK